MSDDHAAGKSTIDAAARQKSADKDGKRPPRDPNLDTGVIPVGSPQLPPVRVAGPASQPRRPMRGPDLIAGASVAGGRYRLLARTEARAVCVSGRHSTSSSIARSR